MVGIFVLYPHRKFGFASNRLELFAKRIWTSGRIADDFHSLRFNRTVVERAASNIYFAGRRDPGKARFQFRMFLLIDL